MTETDPRAEERAFYDDTDYAELDLERAEDVQVARRPEPRSTFALRLDAKTIEQLRDVAQRYGTRPTQIARDWIVERLERYEQTQASPELSADMRRLNDRIDALEGHMNLIASRSYARGTVVSPTHDVDVIAGLEAQVQVARELIQRLDDFVSVEVPPEAGADLLVRRSERSWLLEFKAGDVDLVPSFKHITSLAKRLKARPVLVSSAPKGVEVEAMALSSGVLVTTPDDLDELVNEIVTYVDQLRDRSSEAAADTTHDSTASSRSRRRPAAKPRAKGK